MNRENLIKGGKGAYLIFCLGNEGSIERRLIREAPLCYLFQGKNHSSDQR